MSDFFRRASDALQHRQRQDSADSTNVPDPSDAAKQPEQPSLNQQAGSNQPATQATEGLAGQAAGDDAHPKHRFWVWGHHQDNKPMTKPEPSQAKKDDIDWVIGS